VSVTPALALPSLTTIGISIFFIAAGSIAISALSRSSCRTRIPELGLPLYPSNSIFIILVSITFIADAFSLVYFIFLLLIKIDNLGAQ
jgi:hypothetical protein